jgi:hypothetical protein
MLERLRRTISSGSKHDSTSSSSMSAPATDKAPGANQAAQFEGGMVDSQRFTASDRANQVVLIEALGKNERALILTAVLVAVGMSAYALARVNGAVEIQAQRSQQQATTYALAQAQAATTYALAQAQLAHTRIKTKPTRSARSSKNYRRKVGSRNSSSMTTTSVCAGPVSGSRVISRAARWAIRTRSRLT